MLGSAQCAETLLADPDSRMGSPGSVAGGGYTIYGGLVSLRGYMSAESEE